MGKGGGGGGGAFEAGKMDLHFYNIFENLDFI